MSTPLSSKFQRSPSPPLVCTLIYTAFVSVYDFYPTEAYDVDNASAVASLPLPPRAEWLKIKGTKPEEQLKSFEQEHGEGRVLYQGTCQ